MQSAAARPKDGPRINEEIRVREVQLIDKDGTNHGTSRSPRRWPWPKKPGSIWSRSPPTPVPPVCKMLDYGKYKYQEQKKAAEARKKQKVVEVKEIKFRPMIDDHDYDVKMRSMRRFFEEGDKVKVTLALPRPRDGPPGARHQAARPRQGRHRQDRQGRAGAALEGRQMVMVLAPR